MTDTATQVSWRITGEGFEYCNCLPGCSCNFSAFPSSADGSCKGFVGVRIAEGEIDSVDMAGVDVAMAVDWPGPIHDGGGRGVVIVDNAASDEQARAITEMFDGKFEGGPWALIGWTYELAPTIRTAVTFEGEGIKQTMRVEGVGQGVGDSFRNPVTGDEHQAAISLDDGFIWSHGECGIGSFSVKTGEIDLDFEDSNWINYEFQWGSED